MSKKNSCHEIYHILTDCGSLLIPEKAVKKYIFITALMLFTSFSAVFAGPDNRKWKKIETAHFHIIFQETNRQAAEELHSFCEDAYADIAGIMISEPEGIIPCILKGDYDQANGYTAAPPSRITIYVSPPKDFLFSPYHKNWLHLIFIHELTHYFHMNYSSGIFSSLGAVLGREVTPGDMAFLPPWFVEGIAVYNETRFSKGGRGRSAFFEMLYKAPILESDFFKAYQALAYSSHSPPPGKKYVAGYLLVDYIIRHYGLEAFQEILETFAGFPFLGIEIVIKNVLGISYKALFAGMQQELKNKYQPLRSLNSGPLIHKTGTADYYNPQLYKESILVYKESYKEGQGLTLVNMETGKEENILEVSLSEPYSFSCADTGEIIFTAYDIRNIHITDYTLKSDCYLLKPGADNPVRLTFNAGLWHPAVSSDGNTIIAVQGKGFYSRIVAINPRTGEITPLIEEEGATFFNPVFSPSDDKLAYVRHTSAGQDIWVLDLDAQETPYPLPFSDKTGEYYPRFIDDNTLLFSSDMEGDLALYRASIGSLDSLKAVKVLEDPVGAFSGIQIGSSILYSTYRTSGYCIREKPVLSAGPAVPADFQESAVKTASSPPSQETESLVYRDFPKPLFWLPVPFYWNGIDTIQGLSLGAGFYTIGMSLLGTWNWYTVASTRFNPFQPGIEAALSYTKPKIEASYLFGQGYTSSEESADLQITRQSASLRLNAVSRHNLGISRYLGIESGLTHYYFRYRDEAFSITDSMKDPSILGENQLFAFHGISTTLSKSGTGFDIYPYFQMRNSITAAYPLAVFPDTETGFSLTGTTEFTFPAFLPHHRFRTGLKAQYTSLSQNLLSSPAPRGFLQLPKEAGKGNYLGTVEYLATIARMDAPLLFGLSLHGIGAGLLTEFSGVWTPDMVLKPASDLYLGAELVFMIGSTFTYPVPAGIGVNFRIDTAFSEPFTPSEDIRPYIFFSTNSFLD